MIAKKLHRYRSTILRELRRNTFKGRQMPECDICRNIVPDVGPVRQGPTCPGF
ncbi:hypothetical protein HFO74_35485 [Rhizobium laguerreae]|uniref:Helix-turn-helix domain-containing protein n=1 Tax=Rhizobium laguerreae TaxID=1076926 RepID=A0AB35FPD2_9HYPH|nr:hypothetical protein [Rhizobium leguminosarum]MBY2937761.1 hypothetical protein [Rhizobium leguminosarum]MBY3026817.1 hypothetical protein [Rhizobium leguminosarum]MBY3068629.1 hypothetical protein [Rhizobium laguerreae]